MFGLFKKKKIIETKKPETNTTKDTVIYAPANGQLIPIEKVNDDVFSQKLLGDGYAIIPSDGEITSPVKGKIMTVFPTKHAIGIQTAAGDEVILHIGIDTVDLNGEPFEVFINEGDVVHSGMKLVHMDMEKLSGKDPTIMVVFSNKGTIDYISLEEQNTVQSGKVVGKVVHK